MKNKYKTLLIALTTLTLSFMFVGFAQAAYSTGGCSDNINQLKDVSEKDKSMMIIQCEQLKINNAKGTVLTQENTLEKMDKWSEVALRFAQALGVAAKEFGIAANSFLDTPAGKLTAVFIGWNIFGDHILEGVSMVFGILGACIFFFANKRFRTYLMTVDYEDVHYKNWLGHDKVKKVGILQSWKDLSSHDTTPFWIWSSFILDLLIVAIFSITLFA